MKTNTQRDLVASFTLLMAAFVLSVCLPGQAYCDPDPSQSQDWTVDGFDYFGQGKLTPMVLETYTAKGHRAQDGMVASDKLERTSFRVFYGLTNWANLFLQFNAAKPDGQSYEPEGFEGGFHFDFYEGHNWKLGLAWENEWQRAPKYVDAALVMDFHPLIEYDAPLEGEKYLSFLINPILEKDFIGAGCWEGGYTGQILYHWSKDFSAGVEAYGDVGKFKDMGPMHEEGAYIMPVLNYKWFSFGPGIGLTAGSDRLVFKLNAAVPIDTGIRDVRQ